MPRHLSSLSSPCAESRDGQTFFSSSFLLFSLSANARYTCVHSYTDHARAFLLFFFPLAPYHNSGVSHSQLHIRDAGRRSGRPVCACPPNGLRPADGAQQARRGGKARLLVTSAFLSSIRNQWDAANARRSCDSAPRKWRRVAWSCRLLPCVLRRVAWPTAGN